MRVVCSSEWVVGGEQLHQNKPRIASEWPLFISLAPILMKVSYTNFNHLPQ